MWEDVDNERWDVPISALEHYEYCQRQAALIHVEAYFESNIDTVRGDLAHLAVDVPGVGADRRQHRVWRSLPVWSETLGVHGICDIVQFTRAGPMPVEHKSGRYLPDGPADLQVAAQALCLREMFGTEVPVGVVFSGRDRRRHDVHINAALERRVADAVEGMRALHAAGRIPPPVADRRCLRCSLREGCMPDVVSDDADPFTPLPIGDWND